MIQLCVQKFWRKAGAVQVLIHPQFSFNGKLKPPENDGWNPPAL